MAKPRKSDVHDGVMLMSLFPAPGLQKIHLLGIAILVSILFTASVLWLYTSLLYPAARADVSLVHVQVMTGSRTSANADSRSTHVATVNADNGPLMQDTALHPQAIPHPLPAEKASMQLASVSTDLPLAQAPTDQDTTNPAAAFQRELYFHIAQFHYYPDAARASDAHGTAEVLFSMDRQGHILDATLKASSGSALLDQAALDTVRRAQPLPAIPSNLPNRLTILLPVEFAAE